MGLGFSLNGALRIFKFQSDLTTEGASGVISSFEL